MYLGHYETKIGKKRRVAIPKKFCDALGSEIIVAKWYEGCLTLVSEGDWQEFLDKITGVSRVITSAVRDTERFILGSAFSLSPDKQGRVVIPESLTKYASLKEEVVFVGVGNRVELWDKDNWQKQNEYISENASKFIDAIAIGDIRTK